MPDVTDPVVLRQQIAAQRAEFDALGPALTRMQQQVAMLEQQAMIAARMNQPAQAASFSAQAAAVRGGIAQAVKRQTDLSDLIAAAIQTGSTDACDAGATTPMLLLPLRLETRFDKGANGQLQLRIRIFPDTVHIDALKREPVGEEKAAGALYWSTAGSTDPADSAELRWQRLALAVGASRAAWVAACTGPNPPPILPGDRAVARLLPDRFVAILNPRRPGATMYGEPTIVVGKPVAAAPLLNPLGEAPIGQGDLAKVNNAPVVTGKDKANEDNAAVSPKWIADYAAAEKSGLAITITTGVSANIKELVVVGVRNADPVTLAGELDALLESHRFTDGLAFVAPGTPSNNVAEARAGWSPEPPSAPPAAGAAGAGLTGNGARLAATLGIGGRALAGVAGAADDYDADARAANAALWWPTWGSFLERIDVQHGGKSYRLTDQQRDDLRVAHRDAIRGRGPLPTLRIGRQPYGLLPVGLVQDPAWIAAPADTMLLNGVRQLRDRWTKSAWNLPSVNGGAPAARLLEAQQMAPVSFAVYVRQAVVKDLLADGRMDSDVELETFLDSLVLEDFFGERLGKPSTIPFKDPVTGKPLPPLSSPTSLTLSGEQRPLALPYAHDSDAAVLAQMAAAKAAPAGLDPKSVLQALAALALAEARRHRTRNPLTLLDAVTGKLAGARRVAAGEIAAAQARGSSAVFALAETLRTIDTDRATYARYQPEPGGAAGYAELAAASANVAAGRELAENAQLAIVRSTGYLDEVAEALARLARPALTTRDREILVGEALDLASHRYDAWATALATRRIAALRAKTGKGIRIGAWGYLHDLKPADPPKPGGAPKPADPRTTYNYIHAPSMAHAVTAGILKSAYDAHRLEGAGNAFAIDLSSARVRMAMDLIDARRGGQSLGEALGYRIERVLTDEPPIGKNKLDRFIRNLRRARWTPAPAPVAAGAATGTLTIDQSAPAAAVCDGVALLQAYRSPGGADMLVALTSTAPADNPYLQTGWIGLQPNERAAFLKAFAAVDDAIDATGDLLLAETVHQHAQGNVVRTASVADAATAGTAPVPDPAVIATPTGSRTIAHRAMLLAGPVTGAPAWPGAANPRAAAAPELEAWAAGRLGAGADVVVASGPLGAPLTLQGAGLCALDIVYLAGDPVALAARVRARLGLAADAVLAEERDAGWPPARRGFGEVIAVADQLRQMLVNARPATVADFAIPHAKDAVRQEQLGIGMSRIGQALETLKTRHATLKNTSLPKATIAATLAGLVDFGITEVPDADDAAGVALVAARLNERRRAAEAALHLDPQTGAMTGVSEATLAELIATAGEALFGEGFRVLVPSMPAAGTADPWSAARPSAAPRGRLRRWLADMGSVRPAIARFGEGVLASEALGRPPQLSVVQLAEPQAETVTTDFAGDTRPDGISVIALLERSGDSGMAVGLVFDQYLEPIAEAGPRTSALAFRAPAPNARPPQTMLLAVPPDRNRWTTDRLVATVLEAVDMAKLRGVTLDRAQAVGRMLPAAYVRSWSFDDTPTIDFRGPAGTLPKGMNYVREG
jgi:hypothetical protein